MNIDKIIKELQSVMNLEFDKRSLVFKKYKEKLLLEIKNNPSNIQAYSLVAIIELELRNDEGINILNECFNLNKETMSDDEFSLWATSMSYMLIEEIYEEEKATQILIKAIERNSRYKETYYALGKLYFEKEEFEKAHIIFNKGYDVSNDRLYKYCEAVSLLSLGKSEEGISLLKSIYTPNLKDIEIDGKVAYTLSRELAINGYTQEAKDIANLLLDNDYESFDIDSFEMAELMFLLKDYKMCIKLYDEEDNLCITIDWIDQYFFSLKQTNNTKKAHDKVNQIANDIEKDIKEELNNLTDWDSEEDLQEYIKDEKLRLEEIKKCYQDIFYKGLEPSPKLYYFIICKCYYINCPRHYINDL